MNNITKLLIVIVFALPACLSKQNNITQITPTPREPASVTRLPTISVYEYISDPNSKKECLKINSSTITSQANFNEIYPGTTSAIDVKNLLGEPSQITDGGNETGWYYDNNPQEFFSIIIVGNIVNRINIDNFNLTHPTLKEIVENFGCPDVITLVDTSEHSSGNYNRAVFRYPEIGIEFWFEYGDENKVALTNVPNEIRYIVPIKLVEYLKSSEPFLAIDSPFIKPVYWNEVVSDK